MAIAVGLRAAAGSAIAGIEEASVRALAKLEQVLPAKLRRRVRVLGVATVSYASRETPVDPEILTTLAAAITNKERVRFAYLSAAGAESRRNVEPVGIVPVRHRWYLASFDIDRDDWRIFRVDRIQRPQPTGARFTPRELPAADPAAYVAGERTDWGATTLRYHITIHAPLEQVAGRLGDDPGDITAVGENACRYEAVREDSPEWLAHRLLDLGADFEVREPRELVAELQAVRTRLDRVLGS